MKAKVNNQTMIHEARVFKLVRDNVTLPNGVTLDMDIIRHPGAAAIVALQNRYLAAPVPPCHGRDHLGSACWDA